MIDAHRIIFNGFDSLDFDVTTHLAFDSDNGGTSSFLNRDSVHSEHYDGSYRRIHSYKYNDVVTPTFTFIKQNFEDFTPEENRRMLSWLTASDKPGLLKVYQDDSNVLSYQLFGNFTETEVYKLGNGRVVGYVATFESSAPYAYSRKFVYPEVHVTATEINNNDETNDYLAVSGTQTFNITCDSDEYNKLIYPKVTIVFDEGNIYFPTTTDPMASNFTMIPNVIYSYGDNRCININQGDINDQGKFVLSKEDLSDNTVASGNLVGNHYYFPKDRTVRKVVVDSSGVNYTWKTVSIIGAAITINNSYTLNGETVPKEVIVAGGAPGETIILDGTNKIISSATSNQLKIIGDDFNWEWPSLITGENAITVTGNCKIKFEWLEPRKVGSL